MNTFRVFDGSAAGCPPVPLGEGFFLDEITVASPGRETDPYGYVRVGGFTQSGRRFLVTINPHRLTADELHLEKLGETKPEGIVPNLPGIAHTIVWESLHEQLPDSNLQETSRD